MVSGQVAHTREAVAGHLGLRSGSVDSDGLETKTAKEGAAVGVAGVGQKRKEGAVVVVVIVLQETQSMSGHQL